LLIGVPVADWHLEFPKAWMGVIACSHRGEAVGHSGRSDRQRVSAMDVATWLRGLGLEEYELPFRANAIDARVLRRLTSEDLKDLGVSLVGHRRRSLDAIAMLGAANAPPSLSPLLSAKPSGVS
jgi:uncharacterized protein YjiS (DUF1127 family)